MEEIYIFQLLAGLDFPIQSFIVIHCDDQSTTQIVDNHISHNKMKHAKLHVHNLR